MTMTISIDGGRKESPEERRRTSYLETLAWWCGGFSASDLAEGFGLSPPQAGRVIARTVTDAAGGLLHRKHGRGVRKGSGFVPKVIKREAGSVLGFLRAQWLIERHAPGTGLPLLTETEDVDLLSEPSVNDDVLEAVMRARKERRALAISYLGREGASEMIVSPGPMVYVMNRYHVRCYDHGDGRHKDIVLGRIGAAEVTEQSRFFPEDADWLTFVDLQFVVNPGLDDELFRSTASEWKVGEDGVKGVRCRRAVAWYVVRRFTALTANSQVRWLPHNSVAKQIARDLYRNQDGLPEGRR